MSEHGEKRGGSGVAFGLVLFAFLLVVYLLSIGPAYRITGFQLNVFQSPSFSSQGQRICEIVYWPICRACDHSEFIANSVSWYLGFWQ